MDNVKGAWQWLLYFLALSLAPAHTRTHTFSVTEAESRRSRHVHVDVTEIQTIARWSSRGGSCPSWVCSVAQRPSAPRLPTTETAGSGASRDCTWTRRSLSAEARSCCSFTAGTARRTAAEPAASPPTVSSSLKTSPSLLELSRELDLESTHDIKIDDKDQFPKL